MKAIQIVTKRIVVIEIKILDLKREPVKRSLWVFLDLGGKKSPQIPKERIKIEPIKDKNELSIKPPVLINVY